MILEFNFYFESLYDRLNRCMITVKSNSIQLKKKLCYSDNLLEELLCKKRTERSQLFPLPLAVRKEICVLIRVSLIVSSPLPPPGLFARFHQEKSSGSLTFKGVYDFSNPALQLFDRRMGKRKAKPSRKQTALKTPNHVNKNGKYRSI